MTFQFQQLIKEYIKARGGVSYAVISEVLGSLEGMRFDFDDRVVRDYERKKRIGNGDVW